MNFTLDTNKHLTPVTLKTFNRHKQSFAQAVPYILEAEFPKLNVLHLEKGKLVLQDGDGLRYNVVCSSNTKYDVSPSFTKGYGRCKDGVAIKSELRKLCHFIIFVNIYCVEEINVKMIQLQDLDIPDNGVITFE